MKSPTPKRECAWGWDIWHVRAFCENISEIDVIRGEFSGPIAIPVETLSRPHLWRHPWMAWQVAELLRTAGS